MLSQTRRQLLWQELCSMSGFVDLGVPDAIHSDQGANFEGHLFTEFGKLLGIEKTRTTPYHPQLDGLVEQMNWTLLMMLSIPAQEEERWDEFLPELLMAYQASMILQNSLHSTLCSEEKSVPIDVMFGKNPDPVQKHTEYARELRAHLENAYRLVREHTKAAGYQVCDWSIKYHLCSACRGLWGLVVVRLSWLSGRALAAQAKCPGFDSRWLLAFFTFLYFRLISSKFIILICTLSHEVVYSKRGAMYRNKSETICRSLYSNRQYLMPGDLFELSLNFELPLYCSTIATLLFCQLLFLL